MELGFVYVITTPEYIKKNIWKIGRTKNLKERLKNMNATRFKDDQFFLKMYWQTRRHVDLETGLHTELEKYRKNNEFFQCSFSDVENALEAYLLQKPRDYIYDDAVLIPARSRNLKWFEKENRFSIKENNIEITMNEDNLRQEIKSWIYLFGNEKILKFAHPSFWDRYVQLLKQNFSTDHKTNCEDVDDDVIDISFEMSALFLNE